MILQQKQAQKHMTMRSNLCSNFFSTINLILDLILVQNNKFIPKIYIKLENFTKTINFQLLVFI